MTALHRQGAVCVLALLLCCIPGFGLTIVRDGTPAAAVVISSSPAPCVPAAVAELQEHLRAMSGAELPVVEVGADDTLSSISEGRKLILIGASVRTRELGIDASALAPDGFTLKTTDDCLAIIVATHDLEQADRCERVIELRDGKRLGEQARGITRCTRVE